MPSTQNVRLLFVPLYKHATWATAKVFFSFRHLWLTVKTFKGKINFSFCISKEDGQTYFFPSTSSPSLNYRQGESKKDALAVLPVVFS